MSESESAHIGRRGAAAALVYVFGGMLVSFGIIAAFHAVLPDSTIANIVYGIIALCAMGYGGARYGRVLARITGSTEADRAARGGSSFGALAILAGIGLAAVEPLLVRDGAPARVLPIHVLFAVLFVPAVFLVIALLSAVLAIALRARRVALELALKAGLAGAGAFLLADIVQDLLGRRVGGPNAAATATMLTVMLVGNAAASAAMGAVMARVLARHRRLADRSAVPA